MFNIITSRDFLAKLEADFEEYKGEPQSARRAINCVITAYHLHEWVWGDWLKTDYAIWKKLGGIRNCVESFAAWLDRNCPWFKVIQELTNGAKHFSRKLKTEHVTGYGAGPYGVGPYGESYLLVDLGGSAGKDRWKLASELLEEAVRFWREFFDSYAPADGKRTQ